MERLTCNELKTIRDGFFIHKGNREDGTKYRMLAESAPKYEEIYRKLAEYEDAEEQGLLLRLKLKVGDEFWELNDNFVEPVIYPRKAHSLQHVLYCMDNLGKTTFLTYEEAELELANRQQSHAESLMDERNGR